MHVELFVDGKRIKLNDFVESFFGNTLDGAVHSLSGVNKHWKKMDIKVIK